MTMSSPGILEGVRALADAVDSQPVAASRCFDMEICKWSFEHPGYEHVEVPDLLIGLLTAGEVRWATRNRLKTGYHRKGRLAVIPAGTGLCMSPFSPIGATTVHISPERTNIIFDIDNGADLLQKVPLQFGFGSSIISAGLMALDDELRNPSENGAILAESIITVLLHRVLFSARDSSPAKRSSGLSGSMLRKVREYVDVEMSGPIRLADLASLAALSPFYFCRAFKAETGQTPHQYVNGARIQRAKQMLETNTPLSVTDIALAVGFSSHSHLCTAFRRQVGTTPALYRKSRSSYSDGL